MKPTPRQKTTKTLSSRERKTKKNVRPQEDPFPTTSSGEISRDLHDSEKALRVLLNAAKHSMLLISASGTILAHNEASAELLDCKSSDMPGRSIYDLLPADVADRRRAWVQEVVRTGEMLLLEDQREGKWIGSMAYPVFDGKGRVAKIAIFAQDITQGKDRDQALWESTEKFRSAFDKGAVPMAISGLDGRLNLVNDAFCRMLGYSRPDLTEKSFLEITHPDDRQANKAGVEPLMNGREDSFRMEKRYICRNGRIIWVDMSTASVRDGSGRPLYFVTHAQDITERKNAEEELRQSARRLKTFFEADLIGMVHWNMDGRFIDANSRFLEMVGYSRGELMSGRISWTDLTPPEHHYLDDIALTELRLTGITSRPFEKEYIRKGGDRVPVMIAGAMLDDSNYEGIAFILDITERRRAEKELRDSEEHYRQLVQKTTAIILRIDLQGRITFINNFALQFFGYAAEELLGRHAVGTIIPEKESTGRDLAEMFDWIIADPDRFITNRNENMRKTGERVWVEWTNSGVFDSEGRLSEFLSVGIDITDKVRAEEALKESESVYRTIFENTGTAMLIVEEDTTISLANKEFERLVGYAGEQIENVMSWQAFLPDDERKKALNYHYLRRSSPGAAPNRYEVKMIDAKGVEKNTLVTIDMVPGTPKSIASIIDITDQKRTEKKLKSREQDLKNRNRKIEEVNAALRALLKARDEQKSEIEQTMYNNIKELIFPYVDKLHYKRFQNRDEIFEILKNNLKHVCSPLIRNIRTLYSELTPKEIQVINLVREGRTSKEISKILNVSLKAVEFHRDNIRKKLGITNKKKNLLSFIMSLEDEKKIST